MTRLGVFGGQFDPPHNGHLAVLRAARDQLGLEPVLVVPAGVPPHRPEPQSGAETRHALAVAAFDGEPGVEVSRIELDRPGPSYTVDTLELLAAPGRELVLILGADQLAALGSWHRADRVRALATIAVAARPGAPLAEGAVALVLEPVDVSSSGVRCAVARGEDVTDLVPPAVVAVIDREGLYAGTPC